MPSEDRRILAVVGFAALFFGPSRALAQPTPSLGSAASFAVLGGSAVNSTGSTIVTGNLGASPGNTIAGFPPGVVKLGDTFKNDALAKAAQHDAGLLYTQLGSAPCMPLPSLNGPLSLSLPPNVYCISSPSQLTGPLTLDAKGDANAMFIFRMTGAFTTAPDSNVLAINGTQPGNVFWQVGGSAILGARSAFVGNLLAVTNIALNPGASVSGRLLALTGVVTLDTNNASLCSACNPISLDPTSLPDGTVGKPYNQTISASGGTAPYTFKLISGSLPQGLNPLTSDGMLSGAPSQSGTFPFTVSATDSQGCSGEREYTIVIACPTPPLTLSPPFIQDAPACIPYSETFMASGGSGSYEYTFDPLPDGLLRCLPDDTHSVTLCGTPMILGAYQFTVTAKDVVTGCSISQQYTLAVNSNVMISPVTLPPTTACALYRTTFSASCGTAPYTFKAETLPIGFSLSPEGQLCGRPAAPGNLTFTVTATDAKSCTSSRTYTLNVVCNVAILPSALPNGSVSVPYKQYLTASCGTPPYTFTKVSGSLPPGFPLSNPSTTGLLSGTPSGAGVYHFKVMATDSLGCTGTLDYTLFICPLTITPATLPDGTVGTQYFQPITANNGSGSYTFSVPAADLLPDLKLIPADPATSQTAIISGLPKTAGTYTFTVTAIDTVSGCVGSQTYTIKMVACSLTLAPLTLPSASLNSPYSQTITASGGNGSFTFSVSSGSLPPGTTLNPVTGEISGTPTALGNFSFCITAIDTNGCTGVQCYSIVVAVGGLTLSGWGMLILSVLLAGAGSVILRKEGPA